PVSEAQQMRNACPELRKYSDRQLMQFVIDMYTFGEEHPEADLHRNYIWKPPAGYRGAYHPSWRSFLERMRKATRCPTCGQVTSLGQRVGMNMKAVTTTLVQLATGYPSELVWATVCGLSTQDDWIDAGITRWIDPRRILARPWNPGRLARARRMLANGDVAPPINVVGYRLGRGAAIYECEDGIHRTVAAGRRVKAWIKGYCQLRPQT